MKIITKLFDEIEVDEDKIINFPQGIIGFPELKDFLLVHDSESEGGIRWMQSVQEPAFAMPVIDPLIVCPDYNPQVDKTSLTDIGDLQDNDLLILVTVTVPRILEKMTVNLKGPFIINTAGMKAAQTIIDNDEYPVKFPIYDILQKNKEAKEGK